jgi:hypothetical protein
MSVTFEHPKQVKMQVVYAARRPTSLMQYYREFEGLRRFWARARDAGPEIWCRNTGSALGVVPLLASQLDTARISLGFRC